MLTSSLVPISHGALIQMKRLHDRLDRAAVCQQDNHAHLDFWVGTQPIENRTFGRRKGLSANVTDTTLVFQTMNMDVSFSGLPSCGASNHRAK